MRLRATSLAAFLALTAVYCDCATLQSVALEVAESQNSTSAAWWNGLNVPWNSFGFDVGTNAYNATWFAEFFESCAENDVNSARLWLHCDGRATPEFDEEGMVTGLSSSFLPQLRELVAMADAHEIVLLVSLWSFDVCKWETVNGLHPGVIGNDTKTKSYVENALIPILTDSELSTAKNLVFEVANEPEWCVSSTPADTLVAVPLEQWQRFTASIADAVHRYSPHKVTQGSAALKWNSDVKPARDNWWSDSALLTACPNCTLGTLDFYQVHYYDWMYPSYDPCQYDTAYWQLDKPTLVGELPADAGDYYTPLQFMECIFDNGYVGAAFWSYNADYEWTDAIPGWKGFQEQHPEICTYEALVEWLQSLG